VKAGPRCLLSVIFVGDSPNDEPMFRRFPLACAVANIKKYGGYLKHLPAFVATRECADGFAEIVDTVLRLRLGNSSQCQS
jgi:hydroxymethylpyrimidine pyrophosphatase-like HAD family hydrolase